jgi:UDP-glucose 4-epimerase
MDIASAHTKSLIYNDSKLEVFNLGTGEGISILETISSFERVTGKKVNWKFGNRREGDIIEIYANNDKAKKLLKWAPNKDIDSMILSSYNWILSNFTNAE